MKNPMKMNLTTTQEVINLGWMAEARDSDGHLITMLAPSADDEMVALFVRECFEDGLKTTFFSKKQMQGKAA